MEPFGARLCKHLAPARQPGDRVAGALRAHALPQTFAVETEHRLQIGPARRGADLADQVVEDQRLGAGLRVVGQHHVGLYRTARPADDRANVHEPQFRLRHTGGHQAEVFRDHVVFAVAAALAQGFERAGPVVGLAPHLGVGGEHDTAVEELVERGEPLQVVLIDRCGQQRLQRTHAADRRGTEGLRRAQHRLCIPGAWSECGKGQQQAEPSEPTDAPTRCRNRSHGGPACSPWSITHEQANN